MIRKLKIKRILLSLLKELRIFLTKLTVKGKFIIFKTIAFSKVIHLALVTNVPHVIIDQLNKIQKDFI